MRRSIIRGQVKDKANTEHRIVACTGPRRGGGDPNAKTGSTGAISRGSVQLRSLIDEHKKVVRPGR